MNILYRHYSSQISLLNIPHMTVYKGSMKAAGKQNKLKMILVIQMLRKLKIFNVTLKQINVLCYFTLKQINVLWSKM